MSEIIIGVDGTERGEDAVVFGRQLAAFAGGRIVLANVFPYEDVRGRATSLAYRETLREASQEVLDAITSATTCRPGRARWPACTTRRTRSPHRSRRARCIRCKPRPWQPSDFGPIPSGAAVANTVAVRDGFPPTR